MRPNAAVRIALKTSGVVLVFLTIWVPLAFVPGFISFQNSISVVLKESSFLLLAPLAAALALLGIAFGSKPRAAVLFQGVGLPLGLFLAWLLVGFWIAPYPAPAWQETQRWMCYLLTAWTAFVLTVNRGLREKLWTVSLVAAGAAGFYAVLQFYEIDVFDWGSFPWKYPLRRVCASFGNPNFLGGYLVLNLPLALAALLGRRGFGAAATRAIFLGLPAILAAICLWKGGSPSLEQTILSFDALSACPGAARVFLTMLQAAFWLIPWPVYLALKKRGLSSLFPVASIIQYQIAGLLLTFSAGSMAAAAAGGIVLGVLWHLSAKTGFAPLWRHRHGVLGAACGAMILAIVLFAAFKPLLASKASGRLDIYRGTVEMIAERPMRGFGSGMYPVFFPDYRPVELAIYHALGEFYVLHAHSEYLELAAELGLVGLGLFLWTILSVLVPAFKKIAIQPPVASDWWLRAALFSAILATLFHNLISVSLRQVTTAFPFWLTVGWLGGMVFAKVGSGHPGGSRAGWGERLGASVLLPLAILNAFLVTRDYTGDLSLARAIAAQNRASSREALDNYQRAILRMMNPVRAHYCAGSLYYGLQDYTKSLAEYRKVQRLHKNFADVRFNIATSLVRLGKFDEALPHYEEALRINPGNPRLQDYYSRNLILAGREEEGAQARRRAIELYRKAIEQPVHETDPRLYHGLGKNLMFEESWEESEYYLQKARDMDPSNSVYIQGLRELMQYRTARLSGK